MSHQQPIHDSPSGQPPTRRQYEEEDPDRAQIIERLSWTPKQRLAYLVDMVAFEERARRARRLA